MPQSLPLPEGVVAGDLRGVLNGKFRRSLLDATIYTIPPLSVGGLPIAKPDDPNWVWIHSGGVLELRFKVWKDGNEIKIDNDGETDSPLFFTSLTIQIPLSKRLELAAASGGGDGTPPLVRISAIIPDGGIPDGADWQDIPQGGKLVADGAPINIVVSTTVATPIPQEVFPTLAQLRAAGAAGIGTADSANICVCLREKPDNEGQLQWDLRNGNKTPVTDPLNKLLSCDFPASADGEEVALRSQIPAGGGAATPEVVLEAYSGSLTRDAGFTALTNAIDLTQRWDEMNVVADETRTTGGTATLFPSVSMSAVKRGYKAKSGLTGGRTHEIAISANGREATASGGAFDIEASFVLQGTANSITHIRWNAGTSNEVLLNLEVVRWAQSGAKGDTGAGVPDGGTAGQILSKKTATDQDTEWIDAPESGTRRYLIKAYLRIHAGDIPSATALTSGGVWSDQSQSFTTKPTFGAILGGEIYDDSDFPSGAFDEDYDYWEYARYFTEGEGVIAGSAWRRIKKIDQDPAAAAGGYTITTLYNSDSPTNGAALTASVRGHKWVNVEMRLGSASGQRLANRFRGALIDEVISDTASAGNSLRVGGAAYVRFSSDTVATAVNNNGSSANSVITNITAEN